MSQEITPFKISVHQDVLDDIQTRLRLTRYPSFVELDKDKEWSYGAPVNAIQDIVEYWKTTFDWRKIEEDINGRLPQFTTMIDAGEWGVLKVHFVHKRSMHPNAIPLIFSHGWPGNFMEVSKIIDLLVDPKDPKDPAFHVVAPSIPGFSFSEGSKHPGFGLRQTAYVFNSLMIKLGYHHYVAQGGDWGAFVIRSMALRHPDNCRAIHSNMLLTTPPSIIKHPWKLLKLIFAGIGDRIGIQLPMGYSLQEFKDLMRAQEYDTELAGYMHIQSTFPQTLAFGLTDSPTGLLAWIYEKLVGWTDNYPWTKDEILTWVMLYWIAVGPGPAGSLRYYKENKVKHDGVDERVHCVSAWSNVPLGVSLFPKEIFVLPEDWGTMVQPLKYLKRHGKGGHFAAYEVPELLVDDIRNFISFVAPQDKLLINQK